MRWMFCFALAVVCISANTIRAEIAGEQSPEQALEPVLKQISADDYSRAFLEMSILGFPQPTPNQLDEFQLKLKQFRQACGKSLGDVELLDVNLVGKRLARLTYLDHSERHPIVWRFTMYRGSKEWRVIGYNFNGELGDLLEKSNLLSQKPENLKR